MGRHIKQTRNLSKSIVCNDRFMRLTLSHSFLLVSFRLNLMQQMRLTLSHSFLLVSFRLNLSFWCNPVLAIRFA